MFLSEGASLTDNRSPSQRRQIMQSVRTKNTGPEIALRSLIHKMGYRFRLHRKDLPGTPDIVFPGRKKIILVHGCYWHGHNCSKGRLPKTKLEYWEPKIARNRKRDEENSTNLKNLGWDVLTVWQCELKDPGLLIERLTEFLATDKTNVKFSKQHDNIS
jgi:DNA mismatch endonuclease (patch repair protein)